MSESDAVAEITAAGLSYNTVYAVSETPKGTVVSQSISAGTIVDEKTIVTITVSNGTSQWSDWIGNRTRRKFSSDTGTNIMVIPYKK